jgi:hypothetical protein
VTKYLTEQEGEGEEKEEEDKEEEEGGGGGKITAQIFEKILFLQKRF